MVRDSTISDVPARPTLTYAPGAIIADRYEVLEELGRGGMACVYRAKDRATGSEVALKQLLVDMESPDHARVTALFEREFHTLVQLRHPHVIDVYDYRLDAAARPFYTMELLDGGDLRDIAPVEWRRACRMLFDVCSSLALLHSRRLLHRDITPRNIRCTRDGRAKLIDFGAMAPMSDGGADVVGTPAFVAPETLHRLATDARVDLFSLGATLYYALTGYAPYAARTFADALAAWSAKVMAPSAYAQDIPAALDDLVCSLIAVEATLRPQNAFEVMQRLAAIAGLAQSESEAVSRAYLATPMLVGREVVLDRLRDKLLTCRLSRGAGIIIEGRAGMGRTRLLDACALEATTLGFTVMRATASHSGESFSSAHALTRHLLEALSSEERRLAPNELFASADERATDAEPRLRNFAEPSLDPEPLQQAIAAFWLKASAKRPLLIAVDDVHRIDPLSASVLTAVLDKASRARVFVALSADSDEPASPARIALARRCEAITAHPLTPEQTQRLLESLFGAVANLEMLTRELHAVAEGSPRECMEVAQHLVDRDLIRYSAGRWTLPQQLTAAELPSSGAATVRARAASLSAHARFLAEAHALAFYETLSVRDYRALLPALSSQAIDDALSELLAIRALVGDGTSYTLANRIWSAALIAELTPDAAAARHRALSAMYEGSMQHASIYHAFAGGLDERGLTALRAVQAGYAKTLTTADARRKNVGKMMSIYPRVHAVARELGLDQRARNELRRWNLAGTTLMKVSAYPDEARRYLAQLEHDSGLTLYRADPDASDPMQRLMRALQGANERHLATPEAERVYSVEEAIRQLAEYVVVCMVIGATSHDAALLRSLPSLLEPFIALSPLLDSLRLHALCVCDVELDGRVARAHERWTSVLPKLDAITGEQLKFARELANGAAFGLGHTAAELGLPSVLQWADRLQNDPDQRVAALQLRRIERLDHGDRAAAERYRVQAERLRLQTQRAQLIESLLTSELKACAQAGDLNGIQEALDRLQPLAAAYAGWGAIVTHAEACFDLARGDFAAAQHKCEACIAQTAFDDAGLSHHAGIWFAAHATLAEALLALDRTDEALATAERALARWAAHDAGIPAVELVRVHALAQAKLGRADAAQALEAAIAQQVELEVTGLRLGRSYEARAQIAIWQDDASSFEHYAALTAREYRYGADSALAASYERLIHEASRRGWREQASRIGELATQTRHHSIQPSALEAAWSRSLTASQRAEERALSALQLLCGSLQTIAGHLYLNTPHGLVLAASQGSAAPPPLADVSRLLAGTEDRAEYLDDMATSMLRDDEPVTTIQVGALQYELRVLTCVIGDEVKVAGIAAIEAGATPMPALTQSSMLQRLARFLLQAAD